MNIYVYSDESGVFDKEHNRYFVYGGLILLGDQEKNKWARKYAAIENSIRKRGNYSSKTELKASLLHNKTKYSIVRSLNGVHKFGTIITEKKVLSNIYENKKSKQRYLDYAYKIAIKRAFEKMISSALIDPEDVQTITFYVDEHTTATNGRYELESALEQEFKIGTYNYQYDTFYPPIFQHTKRISVEYCNSATKTLIRAADIIANRLYYLATHEDYETINKTPNFIVTKQP